MNTESTVFSLWDDLEKMIKNLRDKEIELKKKEQKLKVENMTIQEKRRKLNFENEKFEEKRKQLLILKEERVESPYVKYQNFRVNIKQYDLIKTFNHFRISGIQKVESHIYKICKEKGEDYVVNLLESTYSIILPNFNLQTYANDVHKILEDLTGICPK